MYKRTQWQDHVTEYEDRYRETRNEDGTITHTPVDGEVLQQGTPQNAANFNHLEEGVVNAGELAALLATEVIHLRQQAEDMAGDVLTVDLTNAKEYPFNGSEHTVSLTHNRNHLDYTVTAEVLEYSGGFVGDVVVSAKLVNGFKIAFTGSAKKVKLKVFVKGGFY